MRPRLGKGPKKILAMVKTVLLLVQCTLGDPMVLEVSDVGKDMRWSLWQTYEEAQYRLLLGLWSKAIPSAVEIYAC